MGREKNKEEKSQTKRKRGTLRDERRKEDTTRSRCKGDKTKGDTGENEEEKCERKVLTIAISHQKKPERIHSETNQPLKQIQPYISYRLDTQVPNHIRLQDNHPEITQTSVAAALSLFLPPQALCRFQKE